ncbi:response regulator transcription factor, partial [Turicimonas muris]
GFKVKSYNSALSFLEKDDFSVTGCIVLDVRMPHMSGIELQNELIRRRCDLPIIFLSAHGDIEMAVEAVHKGAKTFLVKPPRLDKLLEYIKEAVEEHRERQKGRRFAEFLMNQWNSLTEAERQVADMVAKGLTNNMISLVLEITERTVRSHRSSIYEKLEVENAAELSGFLNDLNRYRKAYLPNNPNQ